MMVTLGRATGLCHLNTTFTADSGSFLTLNVPVVDTKLQVSLSNHHWYWLEYFHVTNITAIPLPQAEVLTILNGGMELVSTFTTQMSTFHSYLEQVVISLLLTHIVCYYNYLFGLTAAL